MQTHVFVFVFCGHFVLVAQSVQLISTNENFISVVRGFTGRLQCSVFYCRGEKPLNIAWFKNELMIFNGTDFQPTSGIEPNNVLLQRTTIPEPGDSCSTDEYTLLIKNLTTEDSGKYSCQLHREPQQLNFQIDVLESGLKNGFHENITYDYTECCVEQNVSPLCKPICKPKDLNLEFFDPTSCRTRDYKSFLYCATDNGKRDYVPCCKQRAVPSFCYDFCSFTFAMLKKSHRLCLYYLPEILDCFNKGSMLNLEPPVNLQVRKGRRSRRVFCWQPANSLNDVEYSVHIREVSIFPTSRKTPSSSNRRSRPRRAHEVSGDNFRSNVMLIREYVDQKETEFVRLNRNKIETGRDGEVCISLDDLQIGSRYVIYVQTSNQQRTSEPSPPLFVLI
ncbi:Ig-like and fibronectin type-III domain-containing protein C25G4.10 [Aphelenchoides besseyi]|nr:Ig-like and fibronectin type-III domain-containing protein C25G4.10 [Aphelenchoides besseyi]KAI6200301.1 Ig-like and fibronectin type-III domain-containing protein C25G4.10 [Aphelenchoides besseyi]